jgi:Protein of unknown function (DUF3631)
MNRMANKSVAQGEKGGTPLDALQLYISRFVHLSKSQLQVAALWVVHTYTLQFTDTTPYLAVTSAEKQSGKSRFLEVLETLVMNPWLTGRVTPAVLIRKVDAKQPTLLLDESDAAFAGNKEYAEALRGVLNTGHRRNGKASCCNGQGADISYRDFSTFGAKVIAGIGNLPDTVADRAIPIRLKRAAPGEVVEKFRLREVKPETTKLKKQIESWCTVIAPKLHNARPELPQELTDRQQDAVEPLLAIADAAGAEWPQAARRAILELCIEAQASDDSAGTQLLKDIRQIFEDADSDRLSSSELAASLARIETSPWAEWSHARPLTASKLARLLKPFEIGPQVIRIGDATPRGYMREQFRDAFMRYLRASSADPQGATPQHDAADVASADSSKCESDAAAAGQESEIRADDGPSCTVADSDPPAGQP